MSIKLVISSSKHDPRRKAFPSLPAAVRAGNTYIKSHRGSSFAVERDGKGLVWCSNDWRGSPRRRAVKCAWTATGRDMMKRKR